MSRDARGPGKGTEGDPDRTRVNRSRRDFVRTVVVGSAAGCVLPAAWLRRSVAATGGSQRPYEVHRVSERFEVCHTVRDGLSLPAPSPAREVETAIVGGGPSGLVAGYLLRDREILLLEKEPEVGGNARADAWRGMPYPAGAIVTYAESPAMRLYEELGLRPRRVEASSERGLFVGGRHLEGDLWGSGLDRLFPPSTARRIRRARADLLSLDAEGGRERMDAIPLSRLLRPYGPEAKDWFDRLLAWFAGTTDDYSAYVGTYLARSQMGQGLGVLYPEGTSRGGAYSFPGGLGRAASALREAIEASGADRVLTSATVYRVEQDEAGVTVSYLREGGQAESVRARTAIVAAPKFIGRHIVKGLPAEQSAAMARMRYAPFLVGAVAVDGVISERVRVARTIDAPIANLRDMSTDPALQMFRCEMPRPPGDRADLLEEESFQRIGADVADYFDRIFPGSRRKIDQIRIWRRGHNWYLPVPGMVTDLQPTAARPFGRVFFANADSVGPISEFGWALVAAERAVDGVTGRVVADGRRRVTRP